MAKALVKPDKENVSLIKFPGDDVPVTINFLPFFIDLTKVLSTFELADHALSSIGNNFVLSPSMVKKTSEFFL